MNPFVRGFMYLRYWKLELCFYILQSLKMLYFTKKELESLQKINCVSLRIQVYRDCWKYFSVFFVLMSLLYFALQN